MCDLVAQQLVPMELYVGINEYYVREGLMLAVFTKQHQTQQSTSRRKRQNDEHDDAVMTLLENASHIHFLQGPV